MAKKATFKAAVPPAKDVDVADTPPAPPQAGGITAEAPPQAGGSTAEAPPQAGGITAEGTPPDPPVDGVDEEDLLDVVLDGVDDVESLRVIASALQEHCADLMAKISDLEGALVDAVGEPVALAGVVGPDCDLGAGPVTCAPVYLKKPWARGICEVGDCIGYVTTRDGVDMNLLIDAVRNQVAGETPPVGR